MKDPGPQGPARTAPFQQSAAAYKIAPNPAVYDTFLWVGQALTCCSALWGIAELSHAAAFSWVLGWCQNLAAGISHSSLTPHSLVLPESLCARWPALKKKCSKKISPVLKRYPGFVVIRYGRTLRHRNDCHEERRVYPRSREPRVGGTLAWCVRVR